SRQNAAGVARGADSAGAETRRKPVGLRSTTAWNWPRASFEEQRATPTYIQARHERRGRRVMDILLETLGGLVWLLIGVLGMVAFSSAAREGAGLYGDPSPPPKPQRVLVLDPAEARVIEAAKR